ncbi:MAG: hypothetical protein Q4G34_09870 [Micrococcus sp.]|nr:hypothetical protein [Micrococcus sp.]
MSSAPRPGTPGTFDLRPFEMWERFLLDGAHVGFLHRHMDDAGVLTTRTAFEPTPAVRAEAPELPEKFMSQCQIQFSADGATWQWLHYEDSSLRQRVTIDRERADLGAEVVPSYADALLALAVARSGDRHAILAVSNRNSSFSMVL